MSEAQGGDQTFGPGGDPGNNPGGQNNFAGSSANDVEAPDKQEEYPSSPETGDEMAGVGQGEHKKKRRKKRKKGRDLAGGFSEIPATNLKEVTILPKAIYGGTRVARSANDILKINKKTNKFHRNQSGRSQEGFYIHPSHLGTGYVRKAVIEKRIRERKEREAQLMRLEFVATKDEVIVEYTDEDGDKHGDDKAFGHVGGDNIEGEDRPDVDPFGDKDDGRKRIGPGGEKEYEDVPDDKSQRSVPHERPRSATGDDLGPASEPSAGRRRKPKKKRFKKGPDGNLVPIPVSDDERSRSRSAGGRKRRARTPGGDSGEEEPEVTESEPSIDVRRATRRPRRQSDGSGSGYGTGGDFDYGSEFGSTFYSEDPETGQTKKRRRRLRGPELGRPKHKSKHGIYDDGDEESDRYVKKKIEPMMDYWSKADVDDDLVNEICVPHEKEDPWHLRDPDSADEDDDPNIVKPLSYKKVQQHKWQTHPYDRSGTVRGNAPQKFNWCKADIKYCPLPGDPIVKQNEWVTPCAREIGLGATLFLHTMKALFYLFTFFTLLNLPLFFFYTRAGGNYEQEDGGCTENPLSIQDGLIDNAANVLNCTGENMKVAAKKSLKITDAFGMMSLGNLGCSDYSCASTNLGKNKKRLIFNCPYGTMRAMTQYGIQKTENQTCQYAAGTYIGENDAYGDLQYDCNFDNGIQQDLKDEVMGIFNSKCYMKRYCEMNIKWSWFTLPCRERLLYYASASRYPQFAESENWHFYRRDSRVREPVIFGVAFCVADRIWSPIDGEEITTIDKSEFAFVLLIFDLIVVIVTIWFINLLGVRFRQYAAIFDRRNVEMRDFSLKVSDLPKDYKFGGKEILLHCQLWMYMEQVTKQYMLESAVDTEQKNRMLRDRYWEIVDITFVKNDMKETELLEKLDELDRKKQTKIWKVQKMREPSEDGKEAGGDPGSLNDEIVDVIREYKMLKAEFMEHLEEHLFYKYEITEANGRSEKDVTCRDAFITFRSMRGKECARKAFMEIKNRSGKVLKPDEDKEAFYGSYLWVRDTCGPNNLIWKNLHLGMCNRCIRSICIWTFAILIIAGALLLMIYFKRWNDELKAGAGLDTKCPKKAVEADVALDDWEKAPAQRQGFMNCFCREIYDANEGDVTSALEKFKKVKKKIKDNPCVDWKQQFKDNFLMMILTGAMIGAINGICVEIFKYIVIFEGCQTLEEVTVQQIKRIVIIQYVNVALVLLFADFSTGGEVGGESYSFLGIPILNGKYRDFDTDWYFDVGAKIMMATLANTVAPFFSKLFEPILKCSLRWWDRGRKHHLKKHSNWEDAVRKERQKKLEQEKKEKKANKGKKVKKDEENPQDEKEGGEAGSEQPTGDEEGDGKTKKKPKPKSEAGPEPAPDEPETGRIFQDELNECYTGKLCEVFYLYAWFITNLFVFYTYSGSMPFMYALGAIHFGLAYLIYKFLFIRFHCKTYGFDEHIPTHTLGLIKYALLFHLLMNLFFYTNKRLLSQAPPKYNVYEHYRPPHEPASDFFRRRFNTWINLWVLWYFFAMIVLYMVYKCIYVPVKGLILRKKDRYSDYDSMTGNEDHSDNIYDEWRVMWLRNLYIRAHRDFELFRTLINALSYDQDTLSDERALCFKKILKKRINEVEDTIDRHLLLIGALDRNIDSTYIYKIAVLLSNEQKIQMKNENLQRMVDYTQTYYIYGNEIEYSGPNIILKRIDREMLELEYLATEKPVYY